jgi:hypothetical protein
MVKKNLFEMENYNDITKAPHFFQVHFDETFTTVNGGMHHTGKAYTIICDNVAVHVYGFESEEEAKAFDPLKLRSYLIGSRNVSLLWEAVDEETLLKEINEDQRVKDKVYKLSTHSLYGPIENLPECERMHENKKIGELHCGKPTNEYGDGSCGGCVLQGYDQEEEFYGGFKCPVHTYWSKRFEEFQKKKVT